jgi:hypothetical protein
LPNNNSDITYTIAANSYTDLAGNLGSGATFTDPVILDLDGNGLTFSSVGDGATFDITADGVADRVAWNTSNDGILAMDLDSNGVIDGGSEIFSQHFNGGSFATGSEALASLDGNGDGLINTLDAAFGNLLIWQDGNADGITDAGELKSLAEHGIASITARSTATSGEIDGQPIIGEGTFTRTDGSTGDYVEVALQTSVGTAPIQPESHSAEVAHPAQGAEAHDLAITAAALADIAVEFDDGGGDLDLSVLDTVAAGAAPPQQPQGGEAHTPVADATVPAAIALMHEQAQLAMQLAAS